MFCNYCGANNPGDASFCRKCGNPIRPAQPGAANPRRSPSGSRLTAGASLLVFPVTRSRNFAVPLILLIVILAVGAWLWMRWRAAQPLTLHGQTSFIGSVAFSPDGRLLASGSNDDVIKLWDVRTGKYLRSFFDSHGSDWVAFSPDGRMLASAGGSPSYAEAAILIWDAASGQEVRTISPHVYFIGPVAFSRDGKLIAAVTDSPDGKNPVARLWDVASVNEVRTLSGFRGPLAFSPDGRTLAAANADSISIIDIASGNPLRTISGRVSHDLIFNSGGQMLVAGTGDNAITFWDVASGSVLHTFSDSARIRGIALSADGRFVASGGEDHTIKLFDVSSGTVVRTFSGHTDSVNCVAFSPDGRLLASGSADTLAKIWPLVTK